MTDGEWLMIVACVFAGYVAADLYLAFKRRK
jgi:hypothetical protein